MQDAQESGGFESYPNLVQEQNSSHRVLLACHSLQHLVGMVFLCLSLPTPVGKPLRPSLQWAMTKCECFQCAHIPRALSEGSCPASLVYVIIMKAEKHSTHCCVFLLAELGLNLMLIWKHITAVDMEMDADEYIWMVQSFIPTIFLQQITAVMSTVSPSGSGVSKRSSCAEQEEQCSTSSPELLVNVRGPENSSALEKAVPRWGMSWSKDCLVFRCWWKVRILLPIEVRWEVWRSLVCFAVLWWAVWARRCSGAGRQELMMWGRTPHVYQRYPRAYSFS